MKAVVIAMALVIGVFVLGLPELLAPKGRRDARLEAELFPPFMAPSPTVPTFADVRAHIEKEPSLRRSDKCIDAAFAAKERERSPFRQRAQYTAYLACYLDRLERTPRTLCDPDKRREFARYTRGYFYLLDRDQQIASDPAAAGFLEMDRRLRSKSDISTGPDDFSPDPAIIGGWARLIDIGALSNGESLEDLLPPEVPSATIDKLAALEVVRPLCP
jgi:hypothetical protein